MAAEQHKRAACSMEENANEMRNARLLKRSAPSTGDEAGFALVPALFVIPPDKITAALDAVAFGIKFKGLSEDIGAFAHEKTS